MHTHCTHGRADAGVSRQGQRRTPPTDTPHTHAHTHAHTHMHVHTHTAHTWMQMFQNNGKIEITTPPSTHSPTWALCPSKTLFCKTLFFFKHSPSPWASRNVLWYWNPPSPLPTVLVVLFFLCFMCRLCVTVGYCRLSWPDHLKRCLISMTHSSVNNKKTSLTSGSQCTICNLALTTNVGCSWFPWCENDKCQVHVGAAMRLSLLGTMPMYQVESRIMLSFFY